MRPLRLTVAPAMLGRAQERTAIAAGATIELMVWGRGTPPVALGIGPSLEERRA